MEEEPTDNVLKRYSLECIICGEDTGPLWGLDKDCAGWICPECMKELKRKE